MGYVAPALMGARKKVFDSLRGVFFAPGTECNLVKQSATTNTFELVETIPDGWWLKYSRSRQNFLLEIARDDQTLTDSMAEATHVRIDDDDVYVIREADTLPPKGTDVTWKIFCDRFVERSQFGTIY